LATLKCHAIISWSCSNTLRRWQNYRKRERVLLLNLIGNCSRFPSFSDVWNYPVESAVLFGVVLHICRGTHTSPFIQPHQEVKSDFDSTGAFLSICSAYVKCQVFTMLHACFSAVPNLTAQQRVLREAWTSVGWEPPICPGTSLKMTDVYKSMPKEWHSSTAGNLECSWVLKLFLSVQVMILFYNRDNGSHDHTS
jgi:hypothetical protein